MLKSLIEKHFDDYKTLAVKDYITAHKKYRNQPDEAYTFLKPYDTIIVVALSYPKTYPKYKGKGYGMVSRYAHGTDYHKVFHEKFKQIKSTLEHADVLMHGDADTNPVEERFAGFLSGMGYLGHNQFLIHPQFGTQLFLGTILTNQSLETTRYLQDDCGSCTKCMDACPPGALVDGDFIESRCLSYKTQAKEAYTIETLKPFKSFVWGCDICQIVCPKNKGISVNNHEAFKSDQHAQLHLASLLELSNKQFMKKYRDYAFNFRGGLVLKRNAIALLFNQKQYQHYPLIKNVYEQYKHVPWFEETIKPIIIEMEKKL